jgi:hypothetical protein
MIAPPWAIVRSLAMCPKACDCLQPTPKHDWDRSPIMGDQTHSKGGPHMTYLGHCYPGPQHFSLAPKDSSTHCPFFPPCTSTISTTTTIPNHHTWPPPATTHRRWPLHSPPPHHFSLIPYFQPFPHQASHPPPTFINSANFCFFFCF